MVGLRRDHRHGAFNCISEFEFRLAWGGLENCGGGVRAAKVGCAKAKRIAKEYAKTHDRSIWGYTCSAGRSQGKCVLDRKLIMFALD